MLKEHTVSFMNLIKIQKYSRMTEPESQPQLNEHNKQEYPPMHTAEHILNQTMVRMFGCKRAVNAHIERKKSKCDYELPQPPTEQQIQEIENKVNEIIAQDLPVWIEYTTQEEARQRFDLTRLPQNATETLRIVHVGEYDACPCAGLHVERTAQIGRFAIASSQYNHPLFRIRFRLL